MTIATTTSKASYAGNGSTKAFSIAFPFVKDADIHALLLEDDVETALSLGSHYTLAGAGNSGGGTLTMITAPASGQTLVVWRAPAIVQEVDYVENSAFPAETHEGALDILTMICQSLQEQIDRAVTIPISSSVTPTDYLTTVEGYKDDAETALATATAQAGIATTKAGEASDSADAAAASAASLPNAASIGAGNVPLSNGTSWTGTSVGVGDMLKADNLSGLANAATARTNLGLGTAAVLNSEDTTPTNYLQYAGLL